MLAISEVDPLFRSPWMLALRSSTVCKQRNHLFTHLFQQNTIKLCQISVISYFSSGPLKFDIRGSTVLVFAWLCTIEDLNLFLTLYQFFNFLARPPSWEEFVNSPVFVH